MKRLWIDFIIYNGDREIARKRIWLKRKWPWSKVTNVEPIEFPPLPPGETITHYSAGDGIRPFPAPCFISSESTLRVNFDISEDL